MIALQKRLSNTPVGIIRKGALLIGLLLGVKFDIKAVNHESVIDTYHHLTFQPSLNQS